MAAVVDDFTVPYPVLIPSGRHPVYLTDEIVVGNPTFRLPDSPVGNAIVSIKGNSSGICIVQGGAKAVDGSYVVAFPGPPRG